LLGGAGFIMAKINNKGQTLLFDTFEGFKKNDGLHKKNTFYFNNIGFVKRKIYHLKLKKTKAFKAYFPEKLEVKIENIKLCHIDVNTHNETKRVFNYVKNRLVKNGIIVFDDYGIWGVDGVKKFINILEKKHSKQFIFIKNYMGQCILIKK
jgi:O-methyltransferase